VIHTTLVGLEPTTFRSLVDCWSDVLPVVPPTHRVKLSFVIFDIWALWRWASRVPKCQKLHMTA